MNAGPVTVSIVRHVEPEHAAQMIAWVRSGSSLAERFHGFLGTGWVRPADDSDEWHMLYRFADDAALATWEASSQRQWWLDAAQGRIGQSRVERRTGIEGWFDPPQEHEVDDLTAPPPGPPPRWKQAVTIWLGFFPLSLLATVTLGHLVAGQNAVVRTLATTLCLTPLMTYLVLPRVTRALQWWLHGQPPHWRRWKK